MKKNMLDMSITR